MVALLNSALAILTSALVAFVIFYFTKDDEEEVIVPLKSLYTLDKEELLAFYKWSKTDQFTVLDVFLREDPTFI